MQQTDPPPVVLSRRGPPRRRRDSAAAATDIERALAAHEEITRQQIERGVRAMYRAAVRLMHQVAAEAWAAAGPDADDRLRDRIVHTLARDDALRAMLGQVEERHQAVGLRLDRIEGALRHLIHANREALGRSGSLEVAEVAARLDTLAASVAAAEDGARRLEALSASLVETVRAALADAAPSAQSVEAAATRGAERAVRPEVARVEAAVGRLARLGSALETFPRLVETAPATSPAPGAPGAEERLLALGRRLAWTSARLAAVGGTGNGGAPS